MGMTMTQKILAAHAGFGYCGSRAADRSETRYRDGE